MKRTIHKPSGKPYTELELKAFGPDKVGSVIRLGGGLTGLVRALSNGRVSIKAEWRYRYNGKVRTLHCGTWPKDSLATIRQKRLKAFVLLQGGKDPAEEGRLHRLTAVADQQEQIEAQQQRLSELALRAARLTVSDLFQRWDETALVKHKDGGKEVRRRFKKDVLPALGDVALDDVTRGMVAAVLDTVTSREAPVLARNLLGDIRQMFSFGIVRELVERNPTDLLKRDDFGQKIERDRNLSMQEVRLLHTGMQAANLAETTEAAIWIMLATGCRVGELSKARWENIDLDRGIWRIPPEDAKNGTAITVVLSGFAQSHFETIKSVNDNSRWCLPNRRRTSHVSEKSLTKQITDRQRTDKPMKNRSNKTHALVLPGGRWTAHDLRRTAATLMAGHLKIIPEVVERCLNHKEQNRMKRIYQRHDYKPEMEDAWLKLGSLLRALSTAVNDNVVLLPTLAA